MNLQNHLKQYGIQYFEDDSYWNWAGEILFKKIGPKGVDKLEKLRLPLQNGQETTKERQLFYDFISDPKIANVIHSSKAGAIKASGEKVYEFIHDKKLILDFGCNIGYLTTWYAQENLNSNVIGYDLSKKSIQTAKSFVTRFKLQNVNFFAGDIAQLSTYNFDLIVDTQSIFESEDKSNILDWIFEHLSEDGVFISIPQAKNLFEFVAYFELIKLVGFSVEKIDSILFSDLGESYGYGVFVARKSKTSFSNSDEPETIFNQILKSIKDKN